MSTSFSVGYKLSISILISAGKDLWITFFLLQTRKSNKSLHPGISNSLIRFWPFYSTGDGKSGMGGRKEKYTKDVQRKECPSPKIYKVFEAELTNGIGRREGTCITTSRYNTFWQISRWKNGCNLLQTKYSILVDLKEKREDSTPPPPRAHIKAPPETVLDP